MGDKANRVIRIYGPRLGNHDVDSQVVPPHQAHAGDAHTDRRK